MADQTQRLEIATVRAEVGSNIVYRFSNDAAADALIPTESGDIQNLKQVILDIQADAAEKISIATTIYPTVGQGLAATADQSIFLVQSEAEDEIYTVWKNDAGSAVSTGKTALSATAIQTALDASNEAAQAAEDAADVAISRTAGFLSPAEIDPVTRDNGLPLQDGDRYFNTQVQAEKIYRNSGWAINDSIAAIEDLESDISETSNPGGIPRADGSGKLDMGWFSDMVARSSDLQDVSDALQEYIAKVSSTDPDGGLGLLKFSQEIIYPQESFGARMRKKVLVTDLPFPVNFESEAFDNSPGVQQAIDYCIANKLNLHCPRPKTFAAFKTMQGVNAVLRISGPIVITGDLGEWRNFCNAHFIDGDVGANDIDISGLYLNHNAQALDDLSEASISALDAAVYPNKAYSGYGTETPNNVFGKMFQYAGWPFGVTPDGTTRFAIRFRGDRCFAHRNIIKRAQVVAIRYSDGAKHGAATNNLILESRFNGINFSSDTYRCMAANNLILETLQIGVAVFSPGIALSDHHSVTDNLIINTKPLGENGIEIVGTDPGMIEGGTTTGNTIFGFGSCGIRTVRMKGGCIIANRVKNTCLLPIQQERYPNPSDGSGIFLHEFTQDCVVLGNSVSGSRNVGIRSANDLNTIGTNSVTESGSSAVLINNIAYAANDIRANAGFFKRRVCFGDSVSDTDLGATVGGASLTFSTDYAFIRLLSGLSYSVVDMPAPAASGAVVEIIKTTGLGTVTFTHTNNLSLKGAASVALTTIGSSLRLAYVAGRWREMARNL
ncbi:hypothetical protein [Pseudomonas sp. GD03746]|uniref:hypothetical protein n=1 Tax=Pseudomonas sp. GD03746 TaxID=2975378 RepID=UPI00244AD3C2|nr:hypothetical protein [Pseudomonas sp. GD03746]MDH1575534.1 hypothetical protein [Pseudomonas sp. GD03746]